MTSQTEQPIARRRLGLLAALMLVLLGASGSVWAQQAHDMGTHWVHYSAINTSQLAPEVAAALGVQRSASRTLLNLAVLRKGEDGLDRPVRAQIEVRAVNLAGQRRNLELREFVEQDAVYYIASFPIHNEERMTFHVRVLPEDASGAAREFSFQQQFFVY